MTITVQKRIMGLALAVVFGLTAPGARAQGLSEVESGSLSGFAQDITRVPRLGPSPSVDESHINDYIQQDEQLNLTPDDGNVRVLRTDQKGQLNDFVTMTFPIKNVTPREIRNVLRTIVGLEGGRVEVIRDQVKGENFVQVICPEFMLKHLEAAIKGLDEEWVHEFDTGSADVYYQAKSRNAADVDVIASFYASDSGFSAVDATNNAVSRIDEPYRIDNYLKAAGLVDIPSNQVRLEISIYEVNSNNDMKLGLDYVNWQNGPGRNLLHFIYGGGDAQSRNQTFTSIYDPFVNAGASAVSVFSDPHEVKLLTDYDQYYRSVNYLLTSNYIDFLQAKGEARVLLEEQQTITSANTAFFAAEDEVVALVSTPGDVDTVDADTLQGVGPNITAVRLNAPANPTGGVVTAVENEKGQILFTKFTEVPVRDSDRRVNYERSGATGIFVELTPFVGLESMELVVDVEIGDLSGLSANGQPIINTRTLSTTVRLLDGEEHVIGGLKRRHDVKESNKAPGLGDLPVAGYLFGGETNVDRWNDVIIVVKPHFQLSSQASYSTPQRLQDLKTKVGGGRVEIQECSYGYDQWLFDTNR